MFDNAAWLRRAPIPAPFFRGASPGMKHSILWGLVGSSLISQHISRQIIF
jgi:hypothetical protein